MEQLSLLAGQLKSELATLKKMIFGSRQERFVPADKNQLTLDIVAEQTAVCNVMDARKVSYVKVVKDNAIRAERYVTQSLLTFVEKM